MMSPEIHPAPSAQSFSALARATKADVDLALLTLAKAHTERAAALSPDAGMVIGALFELATRGGKRLRPALLAASYVANGGEGGPRAVVDAGVAFEVLQAYLLIHDDWMDDDDVRRGGPSVHAALRERFDDRATGDACAILAGDFAVGLALEVLASVKVPPARMVAAVREFATMQTEVVTGQILDVRGAATTPAGVETVHRLKTSSYTARAPLAMGAILAGASDDVASALRAIGDPMGIAFQLQDDLLGTFGDSEKTGKSARSDLRRGKRTALIAELEGDRHSAQLLPRVLGVIDAPDEEVDALIRRMVDSGAKARVEARLAALLADARAGIERLPLRAEGKALLQGAVDALLGREK
ncbi:MAG TPA: polyprenyl synthetase family protein [Polyangiaceae bacterium]|nr:polyprenyl synthetase family protein [Polyangiaceae bacterium]